MGFVTELLWFAGTWIFSVLFITQVGISIMYSGPAALIVKKRTDIPMSFVWRQYVTPLIWIVAAGTALLLTSIFAEQGLVRLWSLSVLSGIGFALFPAIQEFRSGRPKEEALRILAQDLKDEFSEAEAQSKD